MSDMDEEEVLSEGKVEEDTEEGHEEEEDKVQ